MVVIKVLLVCILLAIFGVLSYAMFSGSWIAGFLLVGYSNTILMSYLHRTRPSAKQDDDDTPLQ